MPCALPIRSEEHTSELQSPCNLVCRLLLEKKKKKYTLLRPSHSPASSAPRDVTPSPPSPRSAARLLFCVGPGRRRCLLCFLFFFFNDTATTEIYTLSLHDALPIYAKEIVGHLPGPVLVSEL